jgi:hypothetical protein
MGICNSGWLSTAAQQALRSLLQTAAAGHIEQQSLTFKGTKASVDLLQQLPALHVTELHAEVDLYYCSSMQAVAALVRLQHLQIMGSASRHSADGVLAPLATGLQMVTELHIDPVRPVQLLQLPPKLQQLHITLRDYSVQEVQQLAAWLPSHVSIVRSLHLEDWPCYHALDDELEEWAAALITLATAFAAAAAETAAAAAAESAAADGSWRLASLSVLGVTRAASAAPLLRSLPAGSLTYLACGVAWTNTADMAALCSLTALKHLQLHERWHQDASAEDEEGVYGLDYRAVPLRGLHPELVPLSALQQLTRLELKTSAASSL